MNLQIKDLKEDILENHWREPSNKEAVVRPETLSSDVARLRLFAGGKAPRLSAHTLILICVFKCI